MQTAWYFLFLFAAVTFGCLCVTNWASKDCCLQGWRWCLYSKWDNLSSKGSWNHFQDQQVWLGKLNRDQVNPLPSGCSLRLGLSQNSRNGWGCQCQLCVLKFQMNCVSRENSDLSPDSSFRVRANVPHSPTILHQYPGVGELLLIEGPINNTSSSPLRPWFHCCCLSDCLSPSSLRKTE